MTEVKNEKIEVVESDKKPYTLKRLGASNLFAFTTIINKIGFDELKECLQSDEIKRIVSNNKTKNGINIENVGITIMLDLAGIIIKNLEKCKDNIYQLLSDLSGMTKEEIDDLDMNIFIEMIIDVVKKDEFKDFFKVASKLFK